MQAFDIHICLISGQPTPNLVPALSPDMCPKKVIMLVSNEMKEQAGYLKNVLRKYGVLTDEETIENAYDIAVIQKQIEELIGKLRQEKDAPSIVLNLTGGTKPMAIAAQTACFYNDIPYFYLRHDTNEIQLYTPVDGNMQSCHIGSKLKLPDYLEVHGFRLEQKPASGIHILNDRINDLQKSLVLNAQRFSEAIGIMNRLANDAEEQKTLSIRIAEQDRTPDFDKLLDDFQAAGILSVSGDTLRFTSEGARFFANGGWLEDYVFDIVRKLPLQDCQKNCEVFRQSRFASKNEIDVAFMAKDRLYLIECKTRNFIRDKKIGQDTLYKLDSLLPDLGGLNARGMLVSYRKLDDATRKRANDNKIKIVEASQLQGLKNQISTWISQ